MSDLTDKFGSAKHPDRAVARSRRPGLDDASVRALGKLSEALEVVENARGHLYEFHRMSGMADLALQEAIRQLRAAGHDALADDVDEVLVGRDVVPGFWTFQIVEAYDEQYFSVFRAAEHHARDVLADGTRHLFEAEMKYDEQTRHRTPAGSEG
jgi:hypothetical protein